jgi:LysM repeat protein
MRHWHTIAYGGIMIFTSMKKSGHMALLSHFVILGLLALPALSFARSQKEIVRVPEAETQGNSQTMNLLEGYLNSNPMSIGGAFVAILDETTLSPEGDDASAFVDPGKSGTGAISVYVVREGDTLGEIALMFGVSVNTIMWANDLKSRTVRVGQELVILPISGVRHTVKSGDTLASIAKKYKADLDDVLIYNSLSTGTKLAVGDTVIIPDGVVSSAPASVASSGGNQSAPAGYYVRPLKGGRKSQGIHGYNGVDLAASVGTPIFASADGTVIIARTSGYNGGYGLYVAIRHSNGTQTLYGHMSQVNVSVGEAIKQGEVIGAVGSTGRSTGSHLHFEVRGARNPF